MSDCPRLRAQIEAFQPYNEQEAADRLGTILDTIRRMEGSLSYALLMACLGLCVVLVCILLYVF